MDERPRWRLAAVVLAGLVALTALAALTRGDDAPGADPPPATPVAPDEAPAAFLATWRASREATYRTVSLFSRTSNTTGATLRDRIVVAQRPPERLTLDRDGATGLVDGRRQFCTVEGGALRCREVAARRSYEDGVEAQLSRLATYVLGDDPLYVVTAEADPVGNTCFVLTLAEEVVAPPLGTSATYCFDPVTAIPTSARIERVEADDEVVTVQRSTTVTDADLDPATADPDR